jgi:hypothetical protein
MMREHEMQRIDWLGNLKGRDHMGDIVTDGAVILKLFLDKL